MVTLFVLGTLLGGAFTGVFLCHCEGEDIPYPPPYEKLSIETARRYFAEYYRNPISSTGIKGFQVSKDCFQKMKDLDGAIRHNCNGFRLYFGNDGVNDLVIIVPTINDVDQAKDNLMYSLSRKGVSLCPEVCDVNSPVANQ